MIPWLDGIESRPQRRAFVLCGGVHAIQGRDIVLRVVWIAARDMGRADFSASPHPDARPAATRLPTGARFFRAPCLPVRDRALLSRGTPEIGEGGRTGSPSRPYRGALVRHPRGRGVFDDARSLLLSDEFHRRGKVACALRRVLRMWEPDKEFVAVIWDVNRYDRAVCARVLRRFGFAVEAYVDPRYANRREGRYPCTECGRWRAGVFAHSVNLMIARHAMPTDAKNEVAGHRRRRDSTLYTGKRGVFRALVCDADCPRPLIVAPVTPTRVPPGRCRCVRADVSVRQRGKVVD